MIGNHLHVLHTHKKVLLCMSCLQQELFER